MIKANGAQIKRIVVWALAASTLLLAALLIAQCADIYIVGTSAENLSEAGLRINDIYSRELVQARLSRIAWAFYLWLAALAAEVLCRAVYPRETEKSPLSPESRLKLMKTRRAPTPAMLAEQSRRKKLTAVCAVVCALCAGMAVAYFFDPAHFASRDLESVMGAMLLNIAPWLAAALAALLALAQLRRGSVLREIEAAKSAPERAFEPEKTPRKTFLTVSRVALAAAALALIVAGIANGGMRDVLVKAVNICTECIGLG